MSVLTLLGGASFLSADGPAGGPIAQRHRIALLAILIAGRSRPIRREKIIGLLWPERDTEHARRLLNQSVYVLRQALGDDSIVSAADSLQIDWTRVRCDLVEFEQALEAGELERAVSLYGGAFMDGFFLDDAEEFERWVERERTRLADAQARALEELANTAEDRGEWRAATRWRKALVALDPCDTGAALRLMQVLESTSDRAGALSVGNTHVRMLREELGATPPPTFEATIARLRSVPEAEQSKIREHDGEEAHLPLAPVAAAAAAMSQQNSDISSPRNRRPAIYVSAILVVVGVLAVWNWRSNDPSPSSAPLETTNRFASSERPASERTTSVAAYELYKRGSDPAALRDDDAARQARDALREAVALDPNYAAAWAALARMSLRVSAASRWQTTVEANQSAREAARRAVEIDETLADGHAILGMLSMIEFDFPAAEASLDRAISLDPKHSMAREWRATLYLWTARPGEALADAEFAAAANPLAPTSHAEVARALGAGGKCREALARLERVAALRPPLGRVPIISAQCKAQLGMWDEAVADLDDAVPMRSVLRAYLLARNGSQAEALEMRARFFERYEAGQGGAFPLAVVDAGLGDADHAIQWLERSFEDQSLMGTPEHFTVMQPVLDVLAADPRLQRLEPLARLVAARVRSLSTAAVH